MEHIHSLFKLVPYIMIINPQESHVSFILLQVSSTVHTGTQLNNQNID